MFRVEESEIEIRDCHVASFGFDVLLNEVIVMLFCDSLLEEFFILVKEFALT